MKPLLIFLNEVAGGRKLIEAVRAKAADASYVVVVAPQNQPSVGQLFAPEEAAEAARARVDVTLAVLDEFGIEAIGEVLDPEYDLALGDAIRSHRPSEVLLSALYDCRFGADPPGPARMGRAHLRQGHHDHAHPGPDRG